MNHRVRNIGQAQVIELLEQKLAAHNASALKALVRQSLDKACRRIILNIEAVADIDSFGLMALLACHKMAAPDAKIIICGANKNVSNGFSITRLNRMLHVCRDIESALEKVSREDATVRRSLVSQLGSMFARPAEA